MDTRIPESRVRVHWHLRRKTFVLATPGSKPKVFGYTDTICLTDVTFVVRAAGREYCRAKGMRWVHAWVEGTVCGCHAAHGDETDVSYNPFRDETFRTVDGNESVHAAQHVLFTVDAVKAGRTPRTRMTGWQG